MTNKGCLRPGQCKLVQVVLVACFAAFLRDHGCEAQILINNGAGIGVIPPGLRLSQTLQQVILRGASSLPLNGNAMLQYSIAL